MRTISTLFSAVVLRTLTLGTLCAAGAFAVGIETAGDVHPFSRGQAALEEMTTGSTLRGDVNGNGRIDTEDAYVIYQAAQGLLEPTPDQIRRGDTDGDFALTAKDLGRILHALSLQ